MPHHSPEQPTGKIVLVTGASRGLGSRIASYLAREGYRVAFGYKEHAAMAEELCRSLTEEGCDVLPVPCDVTNESSVLKAVAQVTELWGGLDIAIANAGINRDGMSWKMDATVWSEVIATNLTGTFLTFKNCLPPMREQGFGRLIAISSIVANKGVPGTAAYAASKSGVNGLVRAVASEVGRKGITVNAISVGYMDEGMFHRMREDLQEYALQGVTLGRPGDPDELAGFISYLCSEQAGYITGQILSLDGGML